MFGEDTSQTSRLQGARQMVANDESTGASRCDAWGAEGARSNHGAPQLPPPSAPRSLWQRWANGAASLGQNTQQRQPKNFLGLRSRRGARRPPGRVERPMKCGRDSKGMGYIALLCDLRQVAQLLWIRFAGCKPEITASPQTAIKRVKWTKGCGSI